MRKTYDHLQSQVSMDSLVDMVRQKLLSLPDPRNRQVSHTFHDIVMSGFAMFHFKYPSINCFDKQTQSERANLKSLFKIEKLCSDTHLRNTFDAADPGILRELYRDGFDLLKKVGVLTDYRLGTKHLICSIDGVQHFSSKEIHCPDCQVKNHRDGTKTYSHSMLAAALVHPDQKEVFILDTEPIIKQDGVKKNDCELNASHRLFDSLSDKYKDEKLLLIEDALYANGPHLRSILDRKWDFIVSIKPGGHAALFKLFETRQANNAVRYLEYKDDQGTLHRYWYGNDFPLNGSATDVRVNVLMYEEKKKNGKIQRFSWATSLALHARNVKQITRIGRSRWKIENETFNTLKNQGYHFDHNFGHGNKHLCTAFAFLMCLAFQIDQIFQRCSLVFQRLWMTAQTKVKLWEIIRSIFSVTIVYSFKELYAATAAQFLISLDSS